MKRNVIYFVDEDEPARRANLRDLTTLLDNPGIEIRDLAPLKTFAEYDGIAAEPTTAAFILDQKLKPGGMTYNGTDLAAYLRGIDAKMPIYILTGYADQLDEFRGSQYLIEYVIDKQHIEEPTSEEAIIVKARLLRHLDVFNDVRNAREQRFHDLLIKSSLEPLLADEEKELRELEGDRIAIVAAAEHERQIKLDTEIEALKKLLGRDRLL
jgi:hypothetical protein